ncbi:MAG: tetratricopeptide repeat protein [Methylotenera sp.]|nr:tetratricopeptide repeat protein [Methylotenera sp.]NOS96007.1 tetratricopeptide repeat protein [Methylotenera sp.]NOU40095.1 tetratricopeptide repeat protein [Methylotenera sp.]
MSLINQMLKDLEQRGAGSADVQNTISPKISASKPQHKPLPIVKISALILLLIAGAYFWVQKTDPTNNKTPAETIALESQPAPLDANAKAITDTATIEPTEIPQVNTAMTESEPKPLFETKLGTSLPENTQLLETAPISVVNNRPLKVIAEKKDRLATVSASVKQDEAISANKTSTEKPLTKANANNLAIVKQIRPDQQSGNYYRQALTYLEQGRVSEAQASLTQALEIDPKNHDARQTLASLLLENKRNDDARKTLAEGLTIAPDQTDFRMALARLQVEANDNAGALITLEQGMIYAKNNARFHSFIATLLQRAERHEEAVSHYMASLSIGNASPNNTTTTSTLIGLGISLQTLGKLDDANLAFTRVKNMSALSPELALFVDQRLKQINQRLQN